MVMTADQVMTHRDTMRLQPPDILLTNYKMLDYLMIRPADAPIWKDNGTETLKYIVVDELHTFDGAQGTDLACLLRRLKARLKVPKGHLCCVGTCDPGWSGAYRATAGVCQPDLWRAFDTDAVVGESMLQPQEFFGESLIDMTSRVPEPEQADDLQAEHFAEVHAYLQRQAELWCDMARQDVARLPGAWRWASACSHTCSSATSLSCSTVACPPWTNLSQTSDGLSGGRQVGPGLLVWPTRQHAGVDIDRIGEVCGRWRTPTIFAGTSATLDAGVAAPGLQRVGTVPVMRFADDLTPDQHRHHLPLVHCRECGETGWLGTMRSKMSTSTPTCSTSTKPSSNTSQLRAFSSLAVSHSRMLTWSSGIACAASVCVSAEAGRCRRPSCGSETALVSVWVWNPRIQTRHNRTISSHNCPYCGGQGSLTIMGSQAASLISVGISQLFASIYNDDRKLLAFSDSVQDAAHRAGFFGARTYRFNSAPRSSNAWPIWLVRSHWHSSPRRFVTTTSRGGTLDSISPRLCRWIWSGWTITTLSWRMAACPRVQPAGVAHPPDRVGDHQRVCLSEPYWSNIGKDRLIGGRDRPRQPEHATDAILDTLRNEIGGLQPLRRERLMALIHGFLTLLKTKGAVFVPPLHGYVTHFGGYYLLSQGVNQRFMPRFGRHSRTPVFLTTRSDTRFDQLVSRGAQQTWYQDWATRCLGDLCPSIADFAWRSTCRC